MPDIEAAAALKSTGRGADQARSTAGGLRPPAGHFGRPARQKICPAGRMSHPSEVEVRGVEVNLAMQFDLEIGLSIAVDIAHDIGFRPFR